MNVRPAAHLNYVSYLLAPEKVTNADLVRLYPTYTEAQIFKNTGIHTRYRVHPGSLSSDFATACGEDFFRKFPVRKEDIDFLIFCTEGPDYIAPAASCLIQHKLGLRKNIGTFDLTFGCSGYTYGLSMAKSLVESGMAKNVLFITADIPSTVVSPLDPHLNFLFSDGASASLISAKPEGAAIGHFEFGTDGSGEYSLRVRHSAYREPRGSDWHTDPAHEGLPVGRMEMNGEEIFRFSLREVPPLVESVLHKNGLSTDDTQLFIFHQASQIILKSLGRKLRLPAEKLYSNLAEVGNTVSASIPIAYASALSAGALAPGSKLLLAGFGIGYSWSGTVIEYLK